MFGYVVASRDELTPEQLTRYKGCYCGLCRTLKERHGGLSRLTLTYDMTFLTMLLTALYEPAEEQGEEICVMHPIEKHSWWTSEYTQYAADMTMVLSYLKCRDDWDDDCDPIKLAESRFMKRAFNKVCKKYPRQCDIIKQCMEKLTAMEIQRVPEPDAAANLFGELMGGLFMMRDDRWSETLGAVGNALGRFIYIMDSAVDLEKDKKTFSYNPLEGLSDSANDHYKTILDMLIGECVYYFDKLPIVQDADILRNILCSGVWTVYMSKFYPTKKGAAPDDTGSL